MNMSEFGSSQDLARVHETARRAYWLQTLGRLPRVTIAEDEDDMRLILQDVLTFTGFEVRTVEDGTELLSTLEPMFYGDPDCWRPDVIVSDICMPGAEAFRVIRKLRDSGWNTPLIFLSGLRDPRLETIIERLGHAIFVEKPVALDHFEDLVCQAVAFGIE
jgi:two-component system, OmpR family, response regulator